jgi:hypothetical protein
VVTAGGAFTVGPSVVARTAVPAPTIGFGSTVVVPIAGTPRAALSSVSCTDATDCTAVGSEDAYEPIVMTETSGSWGTPTEIPFPAANNAGALGGVSCTSAADCTAVGEETVAGSEPATEIEYPVYATETNGVWVTPTEIPAPPGSSNLGLSKVSCSSAGNCTAVGNSLGTSGWYAFYVTETSGLWGAPVELPAFSSDASSGFYDVSCTGTGDCTAVGADAGAMYVTETNGVWGTPTDVPDSQGESLNSVSCTMPGDCTASVNDEGSGGFVTETNGVWGTPSAASGGVDSLSCTGIGDCVAVGSEYDTYDTETSGIWGTPTDFVTPGYGFVAVSCTGSSTADCTAVGGQTYLASEGEVWYTSGTLGCTQQNITDGAYQISGCLDDGSGGVDTTDQQSSIDGVDVSASANDAVDYSTDSDDVSSTGASMVSLVVGSEIIPIFEGDLSDSLAGPLTFAGVNSQIAGMNISGDLPLTPGALGTASGSVAVTLPAVLGGGQGTLTFTTSTPGGLSKLKVTAPRASFMQLFSVSDLVLEFTAPGTWTVSGKVASASSSTTSTLSGTFTVAQNTITAAELNVSAISLAGILDLSNLSVKYSPKAGWAGQATVIEKGSAGKSSTATVSLEFSPSGVMTAASLSTGPIDLFGALPLEKLSLVYKDGAWALSTEAKPAFAGEGTLSASLAVSASGEITAGNISLKDGTMPLFGDLTLTRLVLDYSSPAGVPTYKADAGVQLPAPASKGVSGVELGITIANGAFASGKFTIKGKVPLVDGILLTKLGGSIAAPTASSGWDVCGSVGLSAGPEIKGHYLLEVDGAMDMDFPSGTFDGRFAMAGDVTVPDLGVLGFGTLTTTSSDTSVTVALGPPDEGIGCPLSDLHSATGLSLGHGVKITATLTGTLKDDTFDVRGSGSFSYPSIPFLGSGASGNIDIDNSAITACGKISGHTGWYGFRYTWSSEAFTAYRGDCPLTKA